MYRLCTLLLLSSYATAFQLPFNIPFLNVQNPTDQLRLPSSDSPRIAIIGAGAGGSSAAFWIGKAKERFGIDVAVDVYERESYIGGRSTTVYPYNDSSLEPVELGASIFVTANKNIWRATDEFNLSRVDFEDSDATTGVWDGERLLLTIEGGSFFREWFGTVKVLWRYGYNAPVKTRALVRKMIEQFVDLYKPDAPTWDNISSLASTFGWEGLIGQTTTEYLDSQGIAPKFSRELVDAATRVNYGQNADEIHALEGLCSVSATGASSVKGGNFQVFEEFLERSGSTVSLNTTVTSITRSDSTTWTVRSDTLGAVNYKAVIIAAPYHSTGISLSPALAAQIPPQPYVHLHVTLLTTSAPYPNPAYFGLKANAATPTAILTTYEGVREGGKEPEFNSLTYHGPVHKVTEDGEREWVVKIFSKQRLEDAWLEEIFQGKVGWVYRKEWDAYPKLPPTTEYPPVKLDDGLYYVNAFEPFISTMETETISSRNIVDLLLHEHFGLGICGPRVSISEELSGVQQAEDENFVLGWDCPSWVSSSDAE
ncbi:hypothetical protein PLICRDRAFT_164925 [Plicaturopsis crispa FD-325 SS-3]|nr:hypothetical protein PLICRDRAFT_164925 [Plicaturopsis crispa FD-325 SS-3]